MGRFLTVVACGVALALVGGCAREPRARDEGRRAEDSKYPPAPSSSPMSKIVPGMSERDVMSLLGPPDDSNAYVTGKAFIPWYFGPDATRFACYWKGKGRVIFMGGNAWGGGRGKVQRVEYDPTEDGIARTK
jgi:hypothetical protein